MVEDSFEHKVREILERIQLTEDAIVVDLCAVDCTTPLKGQGGLMGAAYFNFLADVIQTSSAGSAAPTTKPF